MKEIRCKREPWRNSIELCVFVNNEKTVSVAQPLTMRLLEDGEYIAQPTMHLDFQEAQGLMDELWLCGLRPSEGTGSAGSLAATEKHLKDMQSIAIGLLRKEGVPV